MLLDKSRFWCIMQHGAFIKRTFVPEKNWPVLHLLSLQSGQHITIFHNVLTFVDRSDKERKLSQVGPVVFDLHAKSGKELLRNWLKKLVQLIRSDFL